jgi:hypothetical protein
LDGTGRHSSDPADGRCPSNGVAQRLLH